MSYYDTFIKFEKSPKERWAESMQELANQVFENSSTYWTDVEEEDAVGTLEFHPIIARVTSLIDAKTGQRVNDDFKKIIFPNMNYHPSLGTRYKFDNNIWIVYSTENIRTDTSSVYIRRCNNVMTTQDKYGNIHREPVYIDYKVTEAQLYKEYTLNVPSGRIQFWCQRNRHTENININDRYIFGKEPYRVREVARFDRTYTFEEDSVKMISFYAELDAIGTDDNMDLGIANYKRYDYKISIVDSISNIVGFIGSINSNVYLNGEIIEEDVIWETTNSSIAEINNSGDYKFLDVGNCKFICRMANKPEIFSVVNIEVTKKNETSFDYTISPDNMVVKQNKTVEFTITEYLNGKVIDVGFDFKANGVSNRNYILTVNSKNSFSITNLKPSNEKLEIICTANIKDPETNLPLQNIFYIELGGIV